MQATDSKLFALCVLLSSSICYNIDKKFDEKTLLDLEVMKKLETRIKIRMPTVTSDLMAARNAAAAAMTSENGAQRPSVVNDEEEYSQHLLPQLMPRIIFTVRDFSK